MLKHKQFHKVVTYCGLTIFLVIFMYFVYKNIASSIIFKNKDRINLIFYSSQAVYYSLGSGNVNYVIPFSPDDQILIPGGYGNYRIGAIGKLISLENKPEIYKRAFSSATSSFIDLYFYVPKSSIYYGNDFQKNLLPSYQNILFTKSNATLLDRIYLLFSFLNRNKNQFKVINETEFFKHYQGFFYKKIYRNIKDNVQIIYSKSYKTALLVSRMIEGEGIRVVDLTQVDLVNKKCTVTQQNMFSKTSIDLAEFFGCNLIKGSTNMSDIIITLGKLEKEWGVE
ncbi:MAG: hypothetical protein Q7R95_03200 [bacterium]|nr:hypothetical protein [bacterium]